MVVIIEVLSNSISQWQGPLRSDDDQPTEAPVNYVQGKSFGFATYLVWVVFAVYVFAAIVFVIGN